MGRERFLGTERWGSRFSAGLGTLLLSALISFLPRWERAWEGGCAGVSEALPSARCPIHASPGAWALPLLSPAFPRSRRGARRLGARRRAVPGTERNEWGLDRRTRTAGAAAGSRPAHPGAPGSRTAQGAGREKFVGISLEVASARVASCLEAEDVEGSGTGWFRHRLISDSWA